MTRKYVITVAVFSAMLAGQKIGHHIGGDVAFRKWVDSGMPLDADAGVAPTEFALRNQEIAAPIVVEAIKTK